MADNNDSGVNQEAASETVVGELDSRQQKRCMRLAMVTAFVGVGGMVCIGQHVTAVVALKLGANEAQLGILSFATFFPFVLSILTINAVERYGKLRIILIFNALMLIAAAPIVLVPFTADKNPLAALWLLIGVTILWRCIMALGNTGWFPLLQDIVPTSQTGSFFAKLRMSWQSASLMVLLGVAFFLTDDDTPWWKFEVIFCGALGALFVRWLLFFGFKQRPPTESKDGKINLVRRFGEFIRHKRARNVGMYSAMYWCCAQLALPFRIKYMKILGYNDGTILKVSAAISLGAIVSLWLWGRLVDTFGNRAVFSITSIGMMITSILWVVVENSAFGLIMIFVLSFLFSAFSSGNNIALTRTMLHVVPKDRQYFMNFIRVLTNGTGALAPLLGGFALYRIRGYSFTSGGIDFNSYHLFFVASGLVCVPLYLMRKRMRRGRELPTSQVLHIVTRPIMNTIGPVINLGNRNDSEDK